jgi:prepilin peptidase CpaA
MVSVSTLLAIVFTVVAGATDLVRHKIYNWTTYPGIIAAFIVNLLEHGLTGPQSLEDALKGFFVCGGLMLAAFVLFHVGGGDVKLMAMLGAFLGLEQGLEVLLWTFVLGGVAGVAILIWRVGFIRLVSGAIRHLLLSLRLVTWVPLSEGERKQLEPPLYLAPASILAVVVVVFDLLRFV